jgi:hypothetical protein
MVQNLGRKVIGIILMILAITSLGSGGYIWLMNYLRLDSNGYMTSPTLKLSSDSPIIVFTDHKFNLRAEIPTFLQFFVNPDNFITERWAIKNNLSKDVFIGIATAEKSSQFLSQIHHKEANEWDVSVSPWEMEIWVDNYNNWPGINAAQKPSDTNIWLTSGSGRDNAQFEIVMVSGDYHVLIMNTDGSPNLDVDLVVGGKIPLMLGLPIPLLAIGIILGGIGLIIYPRQPRFR